MIAEPAWRHRHPRLHAAPVRGTQTARRVDQECAIAGQLLLLQLLSLFGGQVHHLSLLRFSGPEPIEVLWSHQSLYPPPLYSWLTSREEWGGLLRPVTRRSPTPVGTCHVLTRLFPRAVPERTVPFAPPRGDLHDKETDEQPCRQGQASLPYHSFLHTPCLAANPDCLNRLLWERRTTVSVFRY